MSWQMKLYIAVNVIAVAYCAVLDCVMECAYPGESGLKGTLVTLNGGMEK